MAYHIYKTEGVVLGGYEKSEASKALYIFTRDFGLILASAQSIRALKSKLRYALQGLSYAYVDLVKGKGGWRVVNARDRGSFLKIKSDQDDARERCSVMARVSILLRRLLKGEEENKVLFDEVVQALSFLQKTPLNKKELFSAEVVIVMRILSALGYWGDNDALAPFVGSNALTQETIQALGEVRPIAIREINKSLKETQL